MLMKGGEIMADCKLVITFVDADNANRDFTFNYAKSNASTANIKALANGLITNGSIFEHVPVTAKTAKLVVTNETTIDVTD